MKHYPDFTFSLVVAFTILCAVGCSTQIEVDEVEVEVEPVEVTEDLIVTFNGQSCKYNGPQVIREGEITMIMENLSDSPVLLDLAKLDDDKTWQDMLDYIGEPGSYKQRPGWITKEGRRPIVSDNRASIFNPSPGHYVIVCYETVTNGLATYPGSPLEVR